MTHFRAFKFGLAVLLIANVTSSGRAEVACQIAPVSGALVIEDLTVAPHHVWQPYRPISPVWLLNIAGEVHGDRDVRVILNPLSGLPEAVWSAWDGNDFEVEFSSCTAQGWSTPIPLTNNSVDDIAPDLAVAVDGSVGFVWLSGGAPGAVKYRERDPVAGWSPQLDAGGPNMLGLAPRLSFRGQIPKIVFYVRPGGAPTEVIAVTGDDGFGIWPVTFTPELIGTTPWLGNPDPELVGTPNHFFTMWTQSDNQVGYSRFVDNVWQPPEFEPYFAVSGDLPRARARIKGRIDRGE